MRLWMQIALYNWSDIPKPVGAARAHAAGPNPVRILMIGGGPLVGFGVLSHDLALSGTLARILSRSTGRGIDMDIVADVEMTGAAALDALEPISLSRYDAVVLVLGLWDAIGLTPVPAWRRDVTALLDYLERTGPSRLETIVLTLPQTPAARLLKLLPAWAANRHAHALNETLRSCCYERPSATLVPFRSPQVHDVGGHRSSATYRAWAALLAGPIEAVLDRLPEPHSDSGAQNEAKRQESVERLNVLDTAPDERLNRIVAMAQRVFGTAFAAITFLDEDRQWLKARRGVGFTETPRSMSFCDHTIRKHKALIVTDTNRDNRFADNPLVTGEPHIRFYAGYPIEAPDGQRVGALCVFDTKPRDISDSDVALLRDLALVAQDQLWAGQHADERALADR